MCQAFHICCFIKNPCHSFQGGTNRADARGEIILPKVISCLNDNGVQFPIQSYWSKIKRVWVLSLLYANLRSSNLLLLEQMSVISFSDCGFDLLQGGISNTNAASQAEFSEESTTSLGDVFYHSTLDSKKSGEKKNLFSCCLYNSIRASNFRTRYIFPGVTKYILKHSSSIPLLQAHIERLQALKGVSNEIGKYLKEKVHCFLLLLFWGHTQRCCGMEMGWSDLRCQWWNLGLRCAKHALSPWAR